MWKLSTLNRIVVTFTSLLIMSVSPVHAREGDGEKCPRIATTTSTENSGLLREILPVYETANECQIVKNVVGTGRALRLGRLGEVDLVIVHAPRLEKKFIDEGHGVERHYLMKNDFVIAGPASDPASIRLLDSVSTAFAAIAHGAHLFVSRGDTSGTHVKERLVWGTLGLEPYGDWYLETGDSMTASLAVAEKSGAYILVDRGTWLAQKDKLTLEILLEGDSVLDNPYSVIAINEKFHQAVNHTAADRFISWILSDEGQALIANYKVGGEHLFIPARRVE